MYIPLRHNIELVVYKSKGLLCEDETLTETLHTFSQQRKMSKAISDAVFNELSRNNKCFIFNAKQFADIFGKITVEVNTDILYPQMSASLNNLTDDGNCTLRIAINKNFKLMDNGLSRQLQEAIAHELLHAYFILNKYTNSGVIDGVSENYLYQKCAQYIKTTTLCDNTYYFAYCFYMVSGNELNAFVSQMHAEVYNFLSNYKTIDISLLHKAVQQSPTFQQFLECRTIITTFQSCDTLNKNNLINEITANLGLKDRLIIQQFDKLLAYILKRLKTGIKYCCNTAIDAFEKIKKTRQ